MNRGDHVLVPVFGKPVAATVVEPVTVQGNVLVELAVPIWDDRLAPGMITRVVRAPADVVPRWPDRKKLLHVYDHEGNIVQSIPVDGFELVTRDLADDCELAYVLDRPAGEVLGVEGTIEVMNAGSQSQKLNEHTARMVARMYGMPDALVGISTPWWRRLIQRFTRR